jgi:hypothetical protein
MCAATPMFRAFVGSSWGPLVGWRHSGLALVTNPLCQQFFDRYGEIVAHSSLSCINFNNAPIAALSQGGCGRSGGRMTPPDAGRFATSAFTAAAKLGPAAIADTGRTMTRARDVKRQHVHVHTDRDAHLSHRPPPLLVDIF